MKIEWIDQVRIDVQVIKEKDLIVKYKSLDVQKSYIYIDL